MLYVYISSGQSQLSICNCAATVCVHTRVYVYDIGSKVGLTGCANSQEVKKLFVEGQKSSGGAHCGWKNSMISCPDVNN